jgi:hypothetical protein
MTGDVFFDQVQSGVLEAYRVDVCNKYPGNGSTSFTNVAIYQPGSALMGTNPWTNYWNTTSALFFNSEFYGATPSCGFNVVSLGQFSADVQLQYSRL